MVEWIDRFKERFDILFRPLVKLISHLNVKPLHLSIASFIFGIISAFFLFSNHGLFVLSALIHLFLDKLDGSLARYTQNITEKGKWLDYILDGVVLLALLIKSFIVLPWSGINILFTSKIVLICIFIYVGLHVYQIFIKKMNTFGSHLIGILFFMFKQYQLAILVSLGISLWGIIYYSVKSRER